MRGEIRKQQVAILLFMSASLGSVQLHLWHTWGEDDLHLDY